MGDVLSYICTIIVVYCLTLGFSRSLSLSVVKKQYKDYKKVTVQ